MNTILKKYIRNYRNEPIGVVVAIRNEAEPRKVLYGYSLVNSNAERFSKERGTMIAVGRALTMRGKEPKVIERRILVHKYWTDLEDRANRYWKL